LKNNRFDFNPSLKGKNKLKQLDDICEILNQRENSLLSPLATPSKNAYRRLDEQRLKTGYRQAFSVDVDRILNSRAYIRYIDKTQVFYLIDNDHITHRVLHVQLVSKIARTIGRFLRLNEDLIEAIALGHDIGHSPFGHDGEQFLSALCQSHGIGFFRHSVQSVQFLDKVEQKGKGWNLALQTLDGILCHDGEIHNEKLKPIDNKSFKTLENNLIEKKKFSNTQLVPMTLEGCVVRMSDTISYIGRDIEDAIRMDMIQRSDIPKACGQLLGNTNGEIVYSLVTDIIQNSYESDSVTFSPETSEALKLLRAFNYERIYINPKIKTHTDTIRTLFSILFERYLEDIEKENRSSVIFLNFLKGMSKTYIQTQTREEIVRDFIAGMTDQYFLRQCPEDLRPDR
jgi:dGTPase